MVKKHPMKFVLSSIIFILLSSALTGKTLQGKVTQVIDGNTLEFLTSDGERYTLLLDGIDCPELTQAYGAEAKICLEKLALGKSVQVTITGKDRRGNQLAEVLVDGKKDPRIQLLKDGLAWTMEKNANSGLESYRVTSQSKKKGLWKDENPTPPWVHRREMSMLEPKSS
jgi:endonuclease YncB( thermonuclease family)